MGGRGSTPKIYERARRDDWEWLREVSDKRLRSYHDKFTSEAEKADNIGDSACFNSRADKVREELQARGLPVDDLQARQAAIRESAIARDRERLVDNVQQIRPAAAPPVPLTGSKFDAFASSGLAARYRKAFEAGFLAGIERPAVNYVSPAFKRAFEAGLAAGGAKKHEPS